MLSDGPLDAASLPAYARERLATAAAISRDRLLRHDVRLPLLDIEGWFGEARLPALCERRLVMRDAGEPAPNRISLTVLDPLVAGWRKPARWDPRTPLSLREFDGVFERANLRGYHYKDGGYDAPSWQFYDPERRAGLLSLPCPMGIPPWESGAPLRLFMHWAYAQQGVRLTHAATLGIAGTGALLVGAGGSGKSGTTLAGLLNGLQTAGDDYVLIEQGDGVSAHALYRCFKQDGAGLSRAGLDPYAINAAALNWQGKHEFDAAALMPSSFVRKLDIRAILVPEIARLPRTYIEPFSAGAAALALAPSAVLQLPGDAEAGFRFFAQLTRRLPAFRVRLSEDPREIASAIGDHLSGRVGHVG